MFDNAVFRQIAVGNSRENFSHNQSDYSARPSMLKKGISDLCARKKLKYSLNKTQACDSTLLGKMTP